MSPRSLKDHGWRLLMNLSFRTWPLLLACLSATALRAEDFRLVRSVSGPSGRVVGSNFVFDQTRNRFVYPQDKSFVVYFEWDAPPGQHVLSAVWKQPDGRAGFVSPDVKIETDSRDLKSYWTYTLASGMPDGIWVVELRIDGQPAGSHTLEFAGTELPAATSPRPAPTLDEIFRSATKSLVWVHKLDANGKRFDTASGFVVGGNRIATAFQSVDAAAGIEVEFAGGRTVSADGLLAFSRTGDWAVLRADTGDSPAMPLGGPEPAAIGGRMIVFNAEGGARVIGEIGLVGRRDVRGFGQRIQLSAPLTSEAAGGPLMDSTGRAVAILGGSVAPGSRSGRRSSGSAAALWNSFDSHNSAVPLSALPAELPEQGVKLGELISQGRLTPLLSPMPELVFGETASAVTKDADSPLPQTVSEFSSRDSQVWVVSLWRKADKLSKGNVSARVLDAENHPVVTVPPKKLSLSSNSVRFIVGFSPAGLSPGLYRIDLLWEESVAWRGFIRISE